MSFLDLEAGTGTGVTSGQSRDYDNESQLLYNIITKLTDTINDMNRFIQSTSSDIDTNKLDEDIFGCDEQIMIYKTNAFSVDNKSGVRFKLEHDLKEIIGSYEPIKRKYYNKKITFNRKMEKSRNNNAVGANTYGSINNTSIPMDELYEEVYQSLPLAAGHPTDYKQLLIQEEEQDQLNQKELDIHTISVQAHADSVARIQKQVSEVNQIFHNLNDLILSQNNKVVRIEDNLSQFQADVERSESQLKKAERELYKRGNCTLVALVALSIVILLFFILAI